MRRRQKKREKAGTGAHQVPGRWYSLSQQQTGRLPGGVLGVVPCAPALCLGHQGKPPVLRQGILHRCVLVPLSQGAIVRGGHQRAREMAERQVVEQGAICS